MAGQGSAPGSLEVLMRASALNRSPEKVARWYASEPLSAFEGKTAKELVERDGRAQDVLDYLGSVEAGSLG